GYPPDLPSVPTRRSSDLIGGIANVSLVGAGPVRTGDTGPGNCLLDAAAQETGRRADLDGVLAGAGTVHQAALAVLLEDDFYRQRSEEHTSELQSRFELVC